MEELPAPEEKLLRKPTFWEKYAKFRLLILFLILILILIPVLIFINKTPNPPQAPLTLAPTQPLTTSLPTPTTDPTANWKMYTNKKYGIEFKYPSELQLQENEDNVRILQNMGYIFEARKIDTNDDIETWWSKAAKDYTPLIPSKTQFNQKAAYYFKQNSKDVQIPMDMYAIKMNGYILIISYEVPANLDLYTNDKNKEGYKIANEEFAKKTQITINQILSTFKFLDQTADTINWKTYRNEKYGYSIQYPSNKFINCGKDDFYLSEGGEGTRECGLGEEIPTFGIINSLEGTGNFQQSVDEACYEVKKESVVIDGTSSTKYSNFIKSTEGKCNMIEVSYARNNIHIIAYYKNTVYNFFFYEDANKELKYQILSTFKFTQ